jgi:hypothetical protein
MGFCFGNQDKKDGRLTSLTYKLGATHHQVTCKTTDCIALRTEMKDWGKGKMVRVHRWGW